MPGQIGVAQRYLEAIGADGEEGRVDPGDGHRDAPRLQPRDA